MTKRETARRYCCSFWKGACLFDQPCEPEKCSYWPIVAATAARATGKPKKGGTK